MIVWMETILKEKLKGKFIVLDGPDGCGKSTQAELLVKWLIEQGIGVSKFRDPGDTAIGEKIREILLNPEHLAMSTQAEVLLYMAARVQLWAEKIGPALKKNRCVILDRWLSSTCAYQGHAGGFGVDKILKIARDCLEKVWPDLTIILDIDQAGAAGRMNRKLDRMESKGDDYHKKVREGFLDLAKKRDNIFVIDASEEIETIHKNIILRIEEFF
jgi:dTMP kinase